MNNVWTVATRSAATFSRRQWAQISCFASTLVHTERARSSASVASHPYHARTPELRSPLSWQLACRESRTNGKHARHFSTNATCQSKAPHGASSPKDSAVNAPQKRASSRIPEKDLLPGQPFNRTKIQEIFASDSRVDTELGNFIIATIHLRRKRGSLVELGVRPYNRNRAWTESAGHNALEWLRKHHPLDEGLAAAVFAENEARRIEEEVNIQKALKWGLYKPRDEQEEQAVKKAPPTRSEELYGKSALQEMREANEARHEKELARMAKEREAVRERERMRHITKYVKTAELQGKTVKDLVPSGEIKDVVVPRQFMGRDMSEYEKDAMIVKSGPPPKMSTFERLFPSTLVTIVALLGCALFAYYYSPPLRGDRLFSSITPSSATCLSIVAINAAVFLAWRFPPAWRIMNRYFQLSPGYPFAMSILGNTFSHHQASHLAMNMFWMFTVGVYLHDLVGRGNFLALYIGSAAFSSWCSLVFHAATGMFMSSTVGASGPVLAIISAVLWLRRDLGSWRVPFTEKDIDLNGHYILALLYAFEVAYVAGVLTKRLPYKLDHAVHLGGMAFGVAAAQVLHAQSKVKAGPRLELGPRTIKRSGE